MLVADDPSAFGMGPKTRGTLVSKVRQVLAVLLDDPLARQRARRGVDGI